MKRAGKSRIAEIMGIVIIFMFLFIIWKTEDSGNFTAYEKVEVYRQGWQATKDHKSVSVSLPDVLEVQKGTPLVIENVLPEHMNAGNAIVFRSQQQKVTVFVDGQQIYQYPVQEYFRGILPSTWNFVKLPEGSGGKTIQICLESPYEQFTGRVNQVYYGNYNALIDYIKGSYILPYGISILIGAAGVCILVLSVIFYKYKIYDSEMILGCLLTFVSVWMWGESKMLLLVVSSQAQYFLTFLSLSLCPVFFLAYMREKTKGKAEKITFWLFCFTVCLLLVYVILQTAGLYDFVQMTTLMHVVLGASLVYGICIYGKAIFEDHKNENSKETKTYNRREFYCLLLICAAVMIEIIRFYKNNYQDIGIYIRISLLVYSFCLLISNIQKIYLTMIENTRLNEQLHNSKIALMMSQIKPHFIYNTLGTIRVLIRTSPDDAYQMVYDFSTYLRANIDSIGRQTKILFSEELKHIRAYVNIEKVRFEERLGVSFDIHSEAFYIPPLCVQALVENAIKHGICKKESGGCVWIRSYETDKCYVIEVEDNGAGFDTELYLHPKEEEKASAGIQNISFRLKELSNAKLTITSKKGEGTKAVIELPKAEKRL